MKSFEFVASKYSADCIDKYIANSTDMHAADNSILLYPEIRFDAPVRPLSRIEISNVVLDSINKTINDKGCQTLIVVSHSDAVYRDFYQILKTHEVTRFILHIVDEKGEGRQHVIRFREKWYRNLYKELAAYDIP